MPAKKDTRATTPGSPQIEAQGPGAIARTVKITVGQLTYEIEIAVPPAELPVTLDIANGLVRALQAIVDKHQPAETELMNGAAIAVMALTLTARDQRSAFKSLAAAFGGAIAQKPRTTADAETN